MDLTTRYLGMTLKNPLIAAASPLTKELHSIRALEDAGIGAVVMHSLFQEQIEMEDAERQHYQEQGTESFAEATTYFPTITDFYRGPEQYLDHLSAVKKAVDIPVIASLNGTSLGKWIHYAQLVEKTGVDAMELNLYQIAADPKVDGATIEHRYLEVVRAVKQAVKLPVSVKLVPYFSSLAHFAKQVDDAGADGMVLFNRFYQPDIDLESLDVIPNFTMSAPHEMLLPLRWIAILYPLVEADLAGTTGVHTSSDVLKLIMAGASVTQLCAAILLRGPKTVTRLLDGIKSWMAEHDYTSLREMQGSMNRQTCPDPTAFERGQYMKALSSYTMNL